MKNETIDVENRERELNDRAKRPTIVHETVPGEDPIRSNPNATGNQKDKAAVSTSDEDTN